MSQHNIPNLFSSPWFATEDVSLQIAILYANFFTRDNTNFSLEPINTYTEPNLIKTNSTNSSKTSIRFVAEHIFEGVVLKNNSSWHQTASTNSLLKSLANAEANSNVIGHLISLDSGGGSANNLFLTHNFIKNNIKKPVVTIYNGYNASAAYWVSSASDMIFASQPIDFVGSIGAYVTFSFFTKFFKSMGIDIHTIYSSLSPDKNNMFRNVEKGDYKIVKEKYLDPQVKTFIDQVKSSRTNIKETSLTGNVYMPDEAIYLGLIDGIKTKEQAIDKVIELSKTNSLFSINFNNKNMNFFEKISKIIGFNLKADESGNVILSSEAAAKIEEQIKTADDLLVKIDSLNASFDAKLKDQKTYFTEELNTLKTSLSDRIQKVEDLSISHQIIPSSDSDSSYSDVQTEYEKNLKI